MIFLICIKGLQKPCFLFPINYSEKEVKTFIIEKNAFLYRSRWKLDMCYYKETTEMRSLFDSFFRYRSRGELKSRVVQWQTLTLAIALDIHIIIWLCFTPLHLLYHRTSEFTTKYLLWKRLFLNNVRYFEPGTPSFEAQTKTKAIKNDCQPSLKFKLLWI